MATTWRKIIVSGSNAELADLSVSGKLSVTGSVYANLTEDASGNKKVVIFDESTKQLFYTSSAAGGAGGIFVSKDGGVYYATDNTLVVSGSTLQTSPTDDATKQLGASNANSKYAFIVSESAYFANHNVGHPNSLSWQANLDNTIFNSYDANTDVSQILRTIVGVISASNPALVESPLPNSTSFSSTAAIFTGTGGSNDTSDWENAYVPASAASISYPRIKPVNYLLAKGFCSGDGNPLFDTVTTVYQTTAHTFRPLFGSSPSWYFDAGGAGEGVTFIGRVSQSFSDNASVEQPDANTSTYTTSSRVYISTTTSGDGVFVRDIVTGTPTVIPSQYQESYYTSIASLDARKWTDGTSYSGTSVASNANAISSSGYYRWHDITAGFASKSSAADTEVIGGSLATINTSYRFITPLTVSDIQTIQPQNPTGTATNESLIALAFAAESRSLSGAPYLNGASYVNGADIRIPHIFAPLYYSTTSDSTLAYVDVTESEGFVISSSDAGRKVIVNSGQLQAGSRVVTSLGSELSQGDLPATPDVQYTASIGNGDSYAIGTLNNDVTYNVDHTNAVEQYPADANTYFTVRGRFRAWHDGAYDNAYTLNRSFHTAGTFGQPADSGSLLYWIYNSTPGSGQGESATATRFRAETNRLQVQGNTIATAVASTWDSDDRLALGADGDLQYKAGSTYGWLVNPEHGAGSTGVNTAGGYGYWYPTGSYSAGQYKWAVQKFDFGLGSGASYSSLTITTNGDSNFSDLVTWDTTTNNKYSIGVIFSKQLDDAGNPRIFDVAGTGTYDPSLDGQSANTAGINPFNEAVDIKKLWSSRSTGTNTITLGLNAPASQVISNSGTDYSEIYVVIRYKGAPSNTLRAISVSGS